MKKTNKKGFTLVELLAVIVILGVLLMIAVPAVQNVIKSSRKRAFESAAKLAIENTETMASSYNINGASTDCIVFITETSYSVTDTSGATVQKTYKGIELERGSFGNEPTGYIEVINGKGKIYIANDAYSITDPKTNSIDTVAIDSSRNADNAKIPEGKTVCQWVETK